MRIARSFGYTWERLALEAVLADMARAGLSTKRRCRRSCLVRDRGRARSWTACSPCGAVDHPRQHGRLLRRRARRGARREGTRPVCGAFRLDVPPTRARTHRLPPQLAVQPSHIARGRTGFARRAREPARSGSAHHAASASDAELDGLLLEDGQRSPRGGVLLSATSTRRFSDQWRGRLLVNVSSVGLPMDGDHRAAYAILTWDGGEWRGRSTAGWRIRRRSWRARCAPAGCRAASISPSGSCRPAIAASIEAEYARSL